MSGSNANNVTQILIDGCYLIGEFRAGYAGTRAWVDKVDGMSKSTLEAYILVEMVGMKGAQSARLYINPPSAVTDPAQVSIPWKKGGRYVFPIRGLKIEKGAVSGSLDDRREVIPL